MRILLSSVTRQVLRQVGVIALCTAGAGSTIAAQGRQAAAPPPSGPLPQIVAGGIQIANIVAPKDDMMSRPFNAENGTKLVLWIKMPAGQGLIEIDDDTSLLQSFSDDKGTNLGGRIGSFPDEFKDGSGGTVEITSTGLPAAGATRLVAEGTLALNVSSGVKPERVANVSIQNGRTFLLGKTSITVAEVETSGTEQKFTLKLPRVEVERFRSEGFERRPLLELACGNEIDGAESPRVVERQPFPLVRLEQQVIVLFELRMIDPPAPRHAEVEDHRVVAIRVNQPIFGAAAEAGHPCARPALAQVFRK